MDGVMSNEELILTGDVAHRLHLSPAGVRLLERRGELPVAARTPRGTRLYRAADVERLAAERDARKAATAAR